MGLGKPKFGKGDLVLVKGESEPRKVIKVNGSDKKVSYNLTDHAVDGNFSTSGGILVDGDSTLSKAG